MSRILFLAAFAQVVVFALGWVEKNIEYIQRETTDLTEARKRHAFLYAIQKVRLA